MFKFVQADGDSHLYSALLKSYLRELPEPLLGRKKSDVYNMWLEVALLRDNARVGGIKRILKEELPPCVVYNIQYLVKVSSHFYLVKVRSNYFWGDPVLS